MSHFLVLAFGDDVDGMLAPYDENIKVDEYFVGDVSEKEKLEFINHYKEYVDESPLDIEKEMLSLYEKFGKDWNYNEWKLVDGVWKICSTYNPKSKWDWYVEGGRFSGCLTIKKDEEELCVNETTVADIDFNKKTEEVKKEAREYWKEVNDFIEESKTDSFKPWKEIVDIEGLNVVEKREMYNAQPEAKAFAEYSKNNFNFRSVEDFLVSEEEFVSDSVYSSVAPFAYVSEKTGWREQGEMGWFGVSIKNTSNKEWYEEFMSFVAELPPETKVTVIDCHI